jgi:acyl-coenzyme A synthetase/AMP-(fatty) acid ligase
MEWYEKMCKPIAIAELPKTISGKIKRNDLRSRELKKYVDKS